MVRSMFLFKFLRVVKFFMSSCARDVDIYSRIEEIDEESNVSHSRTLLSCKKMESRIFSTQYEAYPHTGKKKQTNNQAEKYNQDLI